jgi:hypothetical protein
MTEVQTSLSVDDVESIWESIELLRPTDPGGGDEGLTSRARERMGN